MSDCFLAGVRDTIVILPPEPPFPTVSDGASLARTEDGRVQILGPDGQVREGATVPDLPDEQLVAFYRELWLARHLDERIDAIQERCRERVADLIEAAEAYEPDIEEWFDNASAEPTPRVREQKESLRALRDRHGDDALLDEE